MGAHQEFWLEVQLSQSEKYKRILRSIQSRAPWLRTVKFNTYNLMTRYLGSHIDPDFHVFAKMDKVGLALDIGANWGQSAYALQRLASPIRVISFEPNPVLSSRLAGEFKGSRVVTIEPVGLADKSGYMDLFIPKYRNFLYDGLASLDEQEARGWLNADGVAGFDPELLDVETHRVRINTLDSYNLSPDIIKINVQGFEEKVVLGGMETLKRSKPVVLVEAPGESLVTLFKTIEFEPYSLWNGLLRKDDTSRKNVFFMTAARRLSLRI